jgi:hypothetical protein
MPSLSTPKPLQMMFTAPAAPIVTIEKHEPLAHTLRIADPAKAKARRPIRPAGVDGYEIYYKIGPTPPASRDECEYWGLVRRSRVFISLPPGTANQTVWYIVVPVNTRWRRGPTSDTVRATIAA